MAASAASTGCSAPPAATPFNNLLADCGAPPAVDFRAHAASLGAMAEQVDGIAGLEAALHRAFAADRTSVVVIRHRSERIHRGRWALVGCRRARGLVAATGERRARRLRGQPRRTATGGLSERLQQAVVEHRFGIVSGRVGDLRCRALGPRGRHRSAACRPHRRSPVVRRRSTPPSPGPAGPARRSRW